MVDPVTAGAVGAGIVTAKTTAGLIERVLGPSADAIGEYLASFAPSRKSAAERIFEKAAEKAGDRSGAASARVVAKAMNDGTWTDDAVVASYLGGMIAESISEHVDDSNIPWASLVGRLSGEGLRLHYMLYEAFARLGHGRSEEYAPNYSDNLRGAELFLPAQDLADAQIDISRLLTTVQTLFREGLVGRYGVGDASNMKMGPNATRIPFWGLVVVPSQAGVELFIHGHGSTANTGSFLEVDWAEQLFEESLPVSNGARFTADLPPVAPSA